MKNNKGITLIALVVTIIVLLILAGVSIAMLTGENGLLTRTTNAKAKDLEATVDEQVRMAAAAVRLEIANKAASDNSYDARLKSKTLGDLLKADLVSTSGKTVNDWQVSYNPEADYTEGTKPSSATITVKYVGSDYLNARNNTTTGITYVITLSQQTLSVGDPSGILN